MEGAVTPNGPHHRYIEDLLAEAPVPARGILSQTLSDEDDVRLVVFSFAPGEELSEHTASRPAIVDVLSGEAQLVVHGEAHTANAGSWLRMSSGTPHAIRSMTPTVLALYVLPSRGRAARGGSVPGA
jgi:quercetin dioxygenase-like cupin family protein